MADPAESPDLIALERFVAENDDLATLERLVGQFNVFEALGVARRELSHSNFLSWLLDPGASHGHGELFLRPLLVDIFHRARQQQQPVAVSPVIIDQSPLLGVRVRREYKNIDLLIECRDPHFVIVLENKVDAGEHGGQLAKYRKTAELDFPGAPSQFVFLTQEGDDASAEGWVAYSYGDIHRVLCRVIHTHGDRIDPVVRTFLQQYLSLIKGHFMEDPAIRELCRKIFAAHGRAIELINQHAASANQRLLESFAEWAPRSGLKIEAVSTTTRDVKFIPTAWRKRLSPIGTDHPPDAWLTFVFIVRDSKWWINLRTRRVSDQAARNAILSKLFAREELNLKPKFATWSEQHRVLLAKGAQVNWDDDEAEPEELMTEIAPKVEAILARYDRIIQFL